MKSWGTIVNLPLTLGDDLSTPNVRVRFLNLPVRLGYSYKYLHVTLGHGL